MLVASLKNIVRLQTTSLLEIYVFKSPIIDYNVGNDYLTSKFKQHVTKNYCIGFVNFPLKVKPLTIIYLHLSKCKITLWDVRSTSNFLS